MTVKPESDVELAVIERVETLLPDVVTDYLDLLLREGTELEPEAVPTGILPESGLLERELPRPEPQQEIPAGQVPAPGVGYELLEEFECLRFVSGQYQLLTPLDRVQRIDYPGNRLQFNGLFIPECVGESNLQMELFDREQYIYFHKILDVVKVKNQDVVWRPNAKRAPWFVGTHKQFLCRVFDPHLLVK